MHCHAVIPVQRGPVGRRTFIIGISYGSVRWLAERELKYGDPTVARLRQGPSSDEPML